MLWVGLRYGDTHFLFNGYTLVIVVCMGVVRQERVHVSVCVAQQGPMTARVVQRRRRARARPLRREAKWRTEKARQLDRTRWQVATSSGASTRPYRHRHVGAKAVPIVTKY
jgi:hypothetical protein